jgi:hypothetical protein
MKKAKFFILTILALCFSVLVGAIGAETGLNPFVVGGITFGASFIPGNSGVLKSGINVEIWQNFIVENLFKNNEFLNKSVDVSGFVLNGSVVHIPNAGNPSSVERNRQNLPAAIKRRSDTDVTYALDEFTSDPVALLRADKIELSYDKMNSVLANDMAKIREVMAEWMIYNWRPEGSAQMVSTTGSSVASHLSGTTGNRKAFALANLKSVMTLMNKANLPKEGRTALFDSNMYEQLLNELDATTYKDFSQYFDATKGVIGRLYGFDIMERSTVLRHATGLTVKTPDASELATDKAGVLCWQETQVEKAVGTVEMFEDLKNPTMYGDIYSFLVRAGGRKRRASNIGVYAIVQDAA